MASPTRSGEYGPARCEHVWRLIAEELIRHPDFTHDTRQRHRRYFCERCLEKREEADPEPIYR